MSNLFKDQEDFFKSVDEGIEIIQREELLVVPDESDQRDLKAMLSLFITATIRMDPEAINDPEIQEKLSTVRLTLLSAYNLGRKRERDERQITRQ